MGYSKDDITVDYADNVLTVKSIKKSKKVKKTVFFTRIAKFFSKAFTIADDVEVKGAELKDVLENFEKKLTRARSPEVSTSSNNLKYNKAGVSFAIYKD